MTINKAQGQVGINYLGVYLVFFHGQLYVTLPRGGLPHKTKVVFMDVKNTLGNIEDNIGKCTTNVVFSEVFN